MRATALNRRNTRFRRQTASARHGSPLLTNWLEAQHTNLLRHTAALRAFQRSEFGNGPETPTEGHIQAANRLIEKLRAPLESKAERIAERIAQSIDEPHEANLRALVSDKERAHDHVRAIERIWDFYFELFGQRQSRFGTWLLGCDRIALDCYQHIFVNLGTARSIPAPAPFAYMRTGFSPATFRRGIPLRRLGQQLNPFPLIQLPYHRLVNPWTLGAILHEVCHNIQNDLELELSVPRAIAHRLLEAGASRATALTWTGWNREIFADLAGLLLGGPPVVGSLMDVIGRSPRAVLHFSPGAPHPTPYLRALLSCELLRRMGFPEEAEAYQRAWKRLYPRPSAGNIPPELLASAPEAIRIVVDAICYQSYPSLGHKRLAQVIRFAPKEQQMVQEAAQRLAAGTDPGVVPERFLIGAIRLAFEQGLAEPDQLTKSFYQELARR
jgi:hypothetical protein